MIGIVAALLVIWLVLVVLGFVIKGLLWLALIGVVLFIATGVWGWLRGKSKALTPLCRHQETPRRHDHVTAGRFPLG